MLKPVPGWGLKSSTVNDTRFNDLPKPVPEVPIVPNVSMVSDVNPLMPPPPFHVLRILKTSK
jgi:hypothetical protein